MKKEVAFFKDRRGAFSAANIISLYRSLGYTDEMIKEEMLRLKANKEQEVTAQIATVAASALGSIKSERKAITSAENGKRGGRPKKTQE